MENQGKQMRFHLNPRDGTSMPQASTAGVAAGCGRPDALISGLSMAPA
jgi:hypothetical protein